MDTIFNSAFGIDLDAQKDPENPFLVEGIRLFRERAEFQTSLLLRSMFKFIISQWRTFKININIFSTFSRIKANFEGFEQVVGSSDVESQ
jgi:hypothetical protein